MSTDDDRFPPLTATENAPSQTPLDLSVLARVASPTTTMEEPPKRRDRPPASRQTSREETPQNRSQQRRKPTTPRTPSAARKESDNDPIKDYSPGILVKPLRDLYVTVGTLVIPFNQPVGTAFIQNAEPCAKALDNAAKADKQIRRVLMLLIQGSVWGEVIIAHMPIMMALAMTMVPSIRATLENPMGNGVQSEGGQSSTETVNPVSNGYGVAS